MSDTMTRVYELGFLLVPSITEGELSSSVDALKAHITKQEGTVLSDGLPEFIDLAYQMEKDVSGKKVKWTQGYFGWIKFEVAPDALAALKKALDADQTLIRYLLIKTTADNSIIFKKPKTEAKRGGSLADELIEGLEDETLDDIAEDDMKEDHEKLPSVEEEVVTAPAEKEETETE